MALATMIASAATGAEAQACFGTPLSAGGIAVEFGAETGESARSVGLGTTLRPSSTLVAAIGYQLQTADTLHNDANLLSARLAARVERRGLSICPFVGAEIADYTEPLVDYDSLGVVLGMTQRPATRSRRQAGVAIGKEVMVRGVFLFPFAMAAPTWVRERARVLGVDQVGRLERRGFRAAGFGLGVGRVHGRLAWSYLTGERAEPKFTFSAGVRTR